MVPARTNADSKGKGESSGAAAAATSLDGVNAASLQYKNQKLLQQLEAQKIELHSLEEKFKELKNKQVSYDNTLITINKIWNQLDDDLMLLGVRAGGDLDNIQAMDTSNCLEDCLTSYPPDQMFLYRILRVDPATIDRKSVAIKFVQEALASRRSSTVESMTKLQDLIAAQRMKIESLAFDLHEKISAEDAVMQLQQLDLLFRDAACNFRKAFDVIHQKHTEYEEETDNYLKNHSQDQSEIKRLSDELEESMADLEECRRKLVVLQMQMHGASAINASGGGVNGSFSPDKFTDTTKCMQELKESVEDAKTLAASRLLELEESQEDNLNFSKQLEELETDLKDDKYVISARPYTLLHDQLQHVNVELERHKGSIECLRVDVNNSLKREKVLTAKVDLIEATKGSISDFEVNIKDLNLQIQKFISERNGLEIKLEEALQDIDRKDIKDEIRFMASALSKEMEMMEKQLKRSKEVVHEARLLSEEANPLRAKLSMEMGEYKSLSDKSAEQINEIKFLKELMERLQKEKQELQIVLDMYGKGCFDRRTIMEIKESEHRARLQAESLQTTLNEHNFELRVNAAKEAEAACQRRLSTAEVEIIDLRKKLDASERRILELTEAIKIKDNEAESYISEIEAIGQAYEDMQTQNQQLVRQVAERDDNNIKLVSDSVKLKQVHNTLISQKQIVTMELQHLNESLDISRTKVDRAEVQIKALLAQTAKASSENRSLATTMDRAKLEVSDAERELKWLRSIVDSAGKEYEQNQSQITDLEMELEKERNERKKLEEDLTELRKEVIEFSPESEEAAIKKLQEEIKECKAILKCGVCFDRPKEVVITKCFHLFCSQCIQRNLEIRHRKCPGCGTPFGQSDVREVNI